MHIRCKQTTHSARRWLARLDRWTEALAVLVKLGAIVRLAVEYTRMMTAAHSGVLC